jgi:hypothetical protein
MMGVVRVDQLDALCQTAMDAALARGHDLGEWEAAPGEEPIARRSSCRRCGRTAYVRAESGLAGAAGTALTERCPGAPG